MSYSVSYKLLGTIVLFVNKYKSDILRTEDYKIREEFKEDNTKKESIFGYSVTNFRYLSVLQLSLL